MCLLTPFCRQFNLSFYDFMICGQSGWHVCHCHNKTSCLFAFPVKTGSHFPRLSGSCNTKRLSVKLHLSDFAAHQKHSKTNIFKKIHSFIHVKFCHSTTSLLNFSIFCISERSRSLKDVLFHSTVYSAVNKPRLWHNQAIADGHKTFVQGTPETPWALSSSAILLLQKEAKINRQMTVE